MVRKYSTGDDMSRVSSFISSLMDVSNPATYGGLSKDKKESDAEFEEKIPGWKCQSTLTLLGFLGVGVAYSIRVSLSIAIVAMVGKNTTRFTVANQTKDICPLPDYSEEVQENEQGEFEWDSQIQGVVLAAFFYGYLSSTVLAGRAAECYGGRIVFGLGIMLCSFLTLISPFCVRISKEAFIINRILQGVTQGAVFPSITTLIATWATPKERSRMVTHVYIGIQAGTIIGMFLGGWICNSKILGGWPLVFYLFGGLGIIWGIPWFLLIHDRPELHPRISPEELRHLQKVKSSIKSAEVMSVPWIPILKSRAFWAIVMMYFSNGYGFYTLLTGLPTYFSDIQHFDLNQSGWTSALPYIVMWIVSESWAQLMNWLTVNNKISLGRVRILSNSVGSFGPAVCLIAMCFVGCDSTMAMVVVCIAVGLNGTCYAGYCASTQDIAPNLSGTLLGLGNTLGGFSGSVAPMIMGAVINNNQTIGAWRIVFIIPVCLWASFALFYIIFISAEVQAWNEPIPKEKVTTEASNLQDCNDVEE